MDKLSILIVEDDRSFALEVEMQLDQLGYTDIRRVASAEEARAVIREQKPDLLLLDILLPGDQNGLELAKSIRTLEIPIIFMTAVTETAVFEQARQLRPFTYLVKPFDRLTLQSNIETAVRLMSSAQGQASFAGGLILRDRIYVKKNNRLERILINDILWIRADGNYCFVQVGEKRFVIKISLRKLLAVLPPHLFTQIQKSFAVHLARVEAIDLNTNNVIVEGHPLPMGRSYRDDIIGRINLIK